MTGHVHDQLAYYAALTAEERRAVDVHCAACEECRATREAYQRQDTALHSLAALRPRRSLRPRPEPAGRRALGYLGNALAAAGFAALVWLFALQAQLAGQGGLAAVPAAPEPGVTLPPSAVILPSPWLPALPWIGGALLLVGALFLLGRHSLRLAGAGALLAAVLLTSFVSPFSMLPNPAGLYWRLAGGYSYDPRLPFKNDFLIMGAPDRQLTPYLDRLIGMVGLTPLDPAQPLARYEIVRVGLDAGHASVARVWVRFVYADDTSRVYPVPLFRPGLGRVGFWLANWAEDGLTRLRSEHLALPGLPFATQNAPIRLGSARRLDLAPAAERLDEVNPGHWLWDSARVQRLVASPAGDAFLAAFESAPGVRRLWLVPFDGSAPVAIGAEGDVREYGWSPDGLTIVYTRVDPDALTINGQRPFAVMVVSRDAPGRPRSLVTALGGDQLPGLNAQGIWFFAEGSLWLAPYDGAPQLVRAAVTPEPHGAPRPAPDGARVAYACSMSACLLDVRGTDAGTTLDLEWGDMAEIAWSPDGARLALVDRDVNGLRPVRLLAVSAAGELELALDIAPDGVADPPQWLPDGNGLLIQTYPLRGRRILAVDLAAGAAFDLSREHWDAYFALAPDGGSVILNNGRGDFWEASLVP